MTPHRIFIGTASLIALIALLPPGGSTAKAEGIIASDVMFPEHRGWGMGGRELVLVDPSREGRGIYSTISAALRNVKPGGEVMVRPGNYTDDELKISHPVTISNTGGGVVRVRFMGPCATIDLRRGRGKVAINGISFETSSPGGACIDVVSASEFSLTASDITSVEGGAGQPGDWCNPTSSGPRPNMNCKLAGVVVRSGIATIQGNRIRRTGTAIALVSPATDVHRVGGNYLAGNGTGVYVSGNAKFLIERNGIFRNHNYGVIIEDGLGLIADNDIEDNYTGLKLLPPSAFSGTAYADGGSTALDYSDMSRPVIQVKRNLITQYGVYRPDSRNLKRGDTPTGWNRGYGPESDDDAHSRGSSDVRSEDKAPDRYGFALDFVINDDAAGQAYLQDNVYDYPKRGSILSGLDITQNCFFGPTQSWFDRDRFTRVIAGNEAWKHVGNDARTPLFAPLFDFNTWVEHLDYDAIDKIDHENSIRSPQYDGFSGGLWKAIHNWFARNKKEMVCAFRFTEPVVSAPGNWPRFDTNPVR